SSNRVTDQSAEDGGNKAFEAYQEARVVIHGGDRRDQHAGQRANGSRQRKRQATRHIRADADQAGTTAVDGGSAQRTTIQRLAEEPPQHQYQQAASTQHKESLSRPGD